MAHEKDMRYRKRGQDCTIRIRSSLPNGVGGEGSTTTVEYSDIFDSPRTLMLGD